MKPVFICTQLRTAVRYSNTQDMTIIKHSLKSNIFYIWPQGKSPPLIRANEKYRVCTGS